MIVPSSGELSILHFSNVLSPSFVAVPGGTGRQCRIQIVSDVLLTLFQSGWEPMTPLDMGLQMKEAGKAGPQVTICFKRKEDLSDSTVNVNSTDIINSQSCLCLETYGSNYLGFHNISNTTLHEMVTTIINDWPPGLQGVSSGVASVISDYIISMPSILPTDSNMLNQKYIQLEGDPWTNENPRQTHQLQMCLIACLIKVSSCKLSWVFRRCVSLSLAVK